MNPAYVYKWVHKPTLNWYVGYHSGHIKNYICSSKTVRALVKQNPTEWEREIVATGSPSEMFELETEILQLFDARNDSRSFNKSNNTLKWTMLGKTNSEEAKLKMSLAKKGKPSGRKGLKNTPLSEETRLKMSLAKKGKPPNNKGKPRSAEANEKFRIAMKRRRDDR